MEVKDVEEILDYLANTLGGDWLLTGGALVRLSFDASRGTEDVDLARMGHPHLSGDALLNQFYQWLIARGHGPEWVNTAVEPFLHEVPQWREETVVLKVGSKGKLFRPNLTLFTYLKIRRGTEIDLEDIRRARAQCPETFDETQFRKWAQKETLARFESSRAALGL